MSPIGAPDPPGNARSQVSFVQTEVFPVVLAVFDLDAENMMRTRIEVAATLLDNRLELPNE